MQRSDVDARRPIRTPLRQRLADLRGGPLAALAFLGASFALWWLLAVQPPPRAFVALVRAEPIVLRAVDGLVVEDVRVELHGRVEAGAVVCVFDARAVAAELAAARAEALALAADIEAQRSALALEAERFAARSRADAERGAHDHAVEAQRLELWVEERRLAQVAAAVEASAIDVERQRYRVRREFLEDLVGDGLTPASEYAELGARLAGLDAQHARLVELEAAERVAELAARERLAAWVAAAPADTAAVEAPFEGLLAPLRHGVDAALAEVARLEAAVGALVLVAPAAGRVERLAAHRGLVTAAGEEIVVLVADGPPRAEVWVPEHSLERLAPGDALVLVDLRDPAAEYEGQVLSTAPRTTALPERLWHDPARAEYGQACLVALPDAVRLLPDTRLVARRAR